jgi:hypothetical protein
MKDGAENFLLCTPEIETIRANEQVVSAQISDTMCRISAAIGDQFRHTMRPVHAKSHGLLRAKLTIQGDVPEQYRQGLFAQPGTFDAIVRLSTIPGDILPDSVPPPRGSAIKVIGTPEAAPMLPGHEQHHTHGFLCETGKAFGVPDAEAFLKQILFFEKHATDSPTLKEAVSTAARLAESAMETVGGRIETLKKLGYPETHILGEWSMCAQLATDLEKTPIEDASEVWPEELSPYVTVASLTAEPQDAYSAARRIFVELAHQPLGNINRARKFACHAAAALRRMQEGCGEIEPTSIHELPA